MRVRFAASATRDVEDVASWWETNRPDAVGAVTEDVRGAATRLAQDAAILPLFRRIGTDSIRRLHLPRTHRHVYFYIDGDEVIVLAVWGAVRGILPRLRARLAESQKS